MSFPRHRPRRLRRSENWRRALRETSLSVNDLGCPLFVVEGEKVRNPVDSMPGVFQLSIDLLTEEALEIQSLGIPAILLFGVLGEERKDAEGRAGYDSNGIVARAIRSIKKVAPDLLIWADVCLCEYTDHGHCGVLDGEDVDNKATLPLLAKTAISHAQAGADMVAPSAMMDGQVAAIRSALDENNFSDIPIMGYSAKYASAFYGPFRIAAGSTPRFGDRNSYQMAPTQGREAMREIAADIEEGADLVMVKPALAYLDVIKEASLHFDTPIAAYNVSGEYSMIAAAGQAGWLNQERSMMEILTSIKRAGADLIITYSAIEAAKVLAKG